MGRIFLAHKGAELNNSAFSRRALGRALILTPVMVKVEVNCRITAIRVPRFNNRNIHSPSPTSLRVGLNKNPSSTSFRRKKVAQVNVDRWETHVWYFSGVCTFRWNK